MTKEKKPRVYMAKLTRPTIICIVMAIFLGVTLFPFLWMLSTSFKIRGEFFTSPPLFIPPRITLSAYKASLGAGGVKALQDSFIIASVSMIFSLILGSMGAYALRGFKQIGKNFAFWILLIEMVPSISIALPLFILYRTLHLLDTYTALILGNTVFVLPFVIWLLMGFLEEIPFEIEEAAQIDGCSRFQIFTQITLPLIKPGLVAVGFFAFILPWNEFLMALIFTRSRVTPLTVVIPSLVMSDTVAWEQVAALSIMAIGPPILIAIVFQRYLVRGLTFGAVKG